MTPNQINAISKAKYEIDKSIKLLKKECQNNAGYGELYFYIYYLHINRIMKSVSDKQYNHMASNIFDEMCKYLISFIYKYGKKEFIKDNNNQVVNILLTDYLTKIVKHINSNHEMISFVSLFDKITLYGERNQFAKIDMTNSLENNSQNKFFNYSYRTQQFTHNKKMNISNHNIFIANFKSEFIDYDDLCKKVFKIDVNTIVNIISTLLNKITDEMKRNYQNCPTLKNGNIDEKSETTLSETIKSMIFSIDNINEEFDSNAMKFINIITFNPTKFNEKELNYHHILRQPIIKINSQFIISPQLLLDGLHINFHYSLLESKLVKHDYKKRSSDFFIDKVVAIGNKYNFNEIDRELELYNGKKQIGDIDLILYNEDDDLYILIEAKNHALPLDVYFGDMIKTEEHLKYLQSKWEEKVLVRFEHLKIKYQNYNIGKNFKYILVSKNPEILSHYSDFLVLALSEFEYYLKNIDTTNSFEDIYTNMYNETNLTENEINKLSKDFTNFSFFKE